jgi:hypothetical protein
MLPSASRPKMKARLHAAFKEVTLRKTNSLPFLGMLLSRRLEALQSEPTLYKPASFVGSQRTSTMDLFLALRGISIVTRITMLVTLSAISQEAPTILLGPQLRYGPRTPWNASILSAWPRNSSRWRRGPCSWGSFSRSRSGVALCLAGRS